MCVCVESACTMKVRLVSCSVLCFAAVVCCRVVVRGLARGKTFRVQVQHASV